MATRGNINQERCFCAVSAEALRAGRVIRESVGRKSPFLSVQGWLVSQLRVAVAVTRGQFRNPEEREHPPS
jgi:hypothetical protein